MPHRCIILALLLVLPLGVSADHNININTADKTALMALNGIGEVKAQAIIDYRTTNPFDTIEEIMNVSGIGTATYNNIKDHITIGTAQSSQTQTQNATSGAQTESTSTQTQTNTTQSTSYTGTPVSSYVPPPEPMLFADAGSDRTVIVGADTEFRGRAYNKSKEAVNNARLTWNFGDGTIREGAHVVHHYNYPGVYAVVLSVAHQIESATDRLVVKAEPAQLGFFVENDGSAVIQNNAGRDLDLSRWVVSAFNRDFVLPPDTIVLAGASMRISSQTLGFFAGLESRLEYPNGALALAANRSSQAPTLAQAPSKPAPLVEAAPIAEQKTTAPVQVPEEPEDGGKSEAPIGIASNVAHAASAASVRSYASIWWLGAFALVCVTGATFFTVRRFRKGEWDIVEDKG